ncbi:MAG: hypothetical protein BroJett010_01570 [Gammaproteobacteria bacterium]|nr:MAG: cytochrome c family protein [Pseudomonadota bacterium]MCE7896246.1 cytochrome c family protein [Gammaproteobacteria bacterium PRO8]GIK33598.1 MAG: hypothetical protein BroJett010_01570 [Gammaproteobacteria bacterium]
MSERCKSRFVVVYLALALAALAGCGSKTAPGNAAPAAAPAAAGDAAAPAAAPSPPPSPELAAMIAKADLNRGKIQFFQCRACHSLAPETEPGKIGPTLYGVIGRHAGSVAGYTYSDAVAKSGITWTAEQIDKWLERPSDFLPGNKMVFVGIQDPQDRANIIAYIQQETAKVAAQ